MEDLKKRINDLIKEALHEKDIAKMRQAIRLSFFELNEEEIPKDKKTYKSDLCFLIVLIMYVLYICFEIYGGVNVG